MAAQLENEIVPFHLDYYLGIREECGDDHLGDADESAQEKMMKALQKKFVSIEDANFDNECLETIEALKLEGKFIIFTIFKNQN